MERGLLIFILLIEYFFQKHTSFVFEFLANKVKFVWPHQLSKLTKNIGAPTWVKCFLWEFKPLQLGEQIVKATETWHFININIKDCLQSFKTIGSFCHGSVMNWVSVVLFVLQCKNVSVTL